MTCKQTVTRAGGMYNTLIGYPPEIISTQSCNPSLQLSVGGGLDTTFKAINYTAFQEQTSFCSARDYPVVGNPNIWSSRAYPFVLSFPSGLDTVDPKWKTCSIFAYGALDPPRTLEKATAMVDPGQLAKPTDTASPGASPTPAQVSATPTPHPSGSPSEGNPPSQGDPPNQGNTPANNDPPAQGNPGDPSAKGDPPAQNDPPAQDDPPVKGDPPAQGNPSEPLSQGDPPSQKDPPANGDPPAQSSPDDPQANGNPPAQGNPSPGPSQPSNAGPQHGPAVSNGAPTNVAINGEPQGNSNSNDPNENGNPVGGAPQGAISNGGSVQGPGISYMPGSNPTANDPGLIVMGTPSHTEALPTIGGNVAHVLPSVGVEVAGSTITPGVQTEVAGTDISVGVGNVVIGGSTFNALSLQSPTPVLAGGQPIVASKGGVLIGGSSYSLGAQATISGTPVSVGAGNLLVGGSTYDLPSYPTQKPIVVDGNTITRADNGDVVFYGSTIAPNIEATVAGHTLFAGTSSVVVDGVSYLLPTLVAAATAQDAKASVITLAGGIVISAGGSAVVVSGTTYSIPSDDKYLIVNGRTTALPTVSQSNLGIITLANGATISAGGSAITVSGTTYSVPLDGGELVVNGNVITIPSSTIQSVFAIAGQTFTAAPTGFTIDGQSVTLDGAAITVSGTVLSLGPSGLQMGSSTIPLTPAQQTQDSGLGGIIMSGFGNGGSGATNSSNPLGFTSVGSRLKDEALTTALALFGISVGVVAYVL